MGQNGSCNKHCSITGEEAASIQVDAGGVERIESESESGTGTVKNGRLGI